MWEREIPYPFFLLLLNCNIVNRLFPPSSQLIEAFCTGFVCLCVCARVCAWACVWICFFDTFLSIVSILHCLPGDLKQVHTFEKRKNCVNVCSCCSTCLHDEIAGSHLQSSSVKWWLMATSVKAIELFVLKKNKTLYKVPKCKHNLLHFPQEKHTLGTWSRTRRALSGMTTRAQSWCRQPARPGGSSDAATPIT